MRIQQLRYFLQIAQTGNITAAARELYISQPSLSQQVHNLEEELGIQLLVRHAKSVTLTDAGEQLALHAQRIVNASDQLVELMRQHGRLLAGNLRLGMPMIAGYLGLFGLLRRFHQAYPGITYELTILPSDQLLGKLKSRDLHGVFLISTDGALGSDPELYHQTIARDEYVALVPRENPLSQKERLAPADLDGQNLILPSRQSVFFRQLELLFQRHGITTHCVCETSQTDIVSQLAGQGLGIGFASASIAAGILPDTCRIVPMQDPIERTVYYVTLRELMEYPSVQAFSEYVAAEQR